jgi:NitT/TauT family transport system substrate-binding protein
MMIRRSFSRRAVLKIGLLGSGVAALGARPAWGRSPVKATQVTAVLYAAHLVAEAGGYFKKESVDVELITSPAGARSAQMLAAAQVNYVLGDTSHAQRLTEQGKPTVVLFVTDQKCPYANIQTRKDLREAGLTSLDKLATMKPKDGGKWKAGATAIGSGTWMYGNFILRSHPIGGGKTLNDLVEWIGVGGVKSQLGALKTEKIDLNMATPEVLIQGATEGYGAVLFDVREDTQWLPVFKGPISATGSYALKTTTQSLKDETQAYVTGVYRAVQWMKTASVEDIAKQLDRYSDTMGLAPESIRKALEWYKPMWTYDLVFTKENYDNVNNVARGIKAEKTYPYEEIVDASFLKKAAGAA